MAKNKRPPKEVTAYLSAIGRKGGKVSGEDLKSPKGFASIPLERRTEIGKKAAAKRWKKAGGTA